MARRLAFALPLGMRNRRNEAMRQRKTPPEVGGECGIVENPSLLAGFAATVDRTGILLWLDARKEVILIVGLSRLAGLDLICLLRYAFGHSSLLFCY